MKKNSNKGFALVETLIVSVFVVSIIGIIFINFYPLIGEAEKRENYDNVDGKYAAFWMRTIFEDNYPNFSLDGEYLEFECKSLTDNTALTFCNGIVSDYGIEKIYITSYNISSFKNIVKENNDKTFLTGFKDYIKYLPNYINNPNESQYRIFLVMHNKKDDNDYYTYSNMEVNLKWQDLKN